MVDFEDLMIFALVYGSTPSDTNWNPVCDIASPDGSTTSDGVIDFEDLMIFAMHYGQRDVVTDVDVKAIIYQSSMGILSSGIGQLLVGMGKYHDNGDQPAVREIANQRELVHRVSLWGTCRTGIHCVDTAPLRHHLLSVSSHKEAQTRTLSGERFLSFLP